jgi:hypothetical protein
MSECIRPNYGVTYIEPGEESQSNEPHTVKLQGRSIYEAPSYQGKIRRQEFEEMKNKDKKKVYH